MSKDPALLWYFNDWMGGTATLSRHLKGCYIDLLCVQFNSGPLSLEEIKTVLGSDFGSSWPALQKKFKFENGLYFNERLKIEKERRSNFTESRRNNAKHMHKHMEDVNENRNENETKKFIKPSIQEIRDYCRQRENKVDALKFFNHYESNGWKVGRNPMKDWKAAVRTWERTSFDDTRTQNSQIRYRKNEDESERAITQEENTQSRKLLEQSKILSGKMSVS